MVTVQEADQTFTGEEASKAAAGPRAGVKYTVEAIGTFFLVFTVGAAEVLANFARRSVGDRIGRAVEDQVRSCEPDRHGTPCRAQPPQRLPACGAPRHPIRFRSSPHSNRHGRVVNPATFRGRFRVGTWTESIYPIAIQVVRPAGISGATMGSQATHPIWRSMPSHARARIALAGGALMVALAAAVGGGVGLSDATRPALVADPAPVEEPAPPPPVASEAPRPSTVDKVRTGRHHYLVPSEIRD